MTTISSIDARYAQTSVANSATQVSASVANLTSGVKQNASVADLSVGTILASRVTTLRVAVGNAGQANSLLKTAKGGLDTILSLLQQQQSLATKASDASLSDNERGFLNQEFVGLQTEINAIATYTNFNGVALLDGSISGSAGAKTATGISTENYSLINSSQFGVSGTAAAGSGYINTTEAVAASNTLTFANSSSTAGTATVTFTDAGGKFGASTLTNTFTYAVSAGENAADIAAAFVASVKVQQALTPSSAGGSASNHILRQFDFIDNGDGTVQVKARTATTDVNSVTIAIAQSAGTDSVYLGKGGASTGVSIGSGGAANAFADGTAAHQGVAGVTGTLNILQGGNVANTASTNTITFGNASANAGQNITLAIGGTIVATYTTLTTTDSSTAIAAALVAQANASTVDGARRFTFSAAAGVVTITNNDLGAVTSSDAITFAATVGTSGVTAALGATSIAGANAAFNSGTAFAAGANASISDDTQTYDAKLQGAISSLSAAYTTGTGGNNDTIQFTAVVGGETYKSQVVNLYGASGDTILASTKLTFTNVNGEVNSSGLQTGPSFQLNIASSAITSITSQSAANTLATGIQAQIESLSIYQSRSLSLTAVDASSGNYELKSTVGTILQGLLSFDSSGGTTITSDASGDIQITGNDFATDGTFGSVGSFSVNKDTDTITTTLNGKTYTAYLNSTNAPTTGDVQAFGTDANGQTNNGTYDSTTKIISLLPDTGVTNTGSQPKLVFYSASTTDGNTITVNLGNVSKYTQKIDISTTTGATALEDALNAAFDVSSNDSLSFQVGASSSDAIGVSIGSAKTTALYTDSDGASTTISITTLANAQAASEILDNAINNVAALEATVSAAISSFNAAIRNGNSSIQNADAARSELVDTDYTAESTNFAEARVRVDAATAVLSQINARAQGLLTLLRQ